MSQKRHEKLTAQAESDIRSYQETTADLTDRIESVHAKEISSLSETIDELKGRLDEATKARKPERQPDDNMLLKEANRLRESAKTTESQLRRLQQQLDSKSQEFEMEKRKRKETEARLAAEIGRTHEKSNEAVLLEKTQDELRSVEKKLRAANEREIKTKDGGGSVLGDRPEEHQIRGGVQDVDGSMQRAGRKRLRVRGRFGARNFEK
ncbi:vicilin-like seed storage protein At2g18540 [Anneissia japonica]|uniref:vicilin-like seed storage protein At2g18540 n=1 Tax=Anneissia japonica TaxID=1529436 RepID=UPI0014256D94|nr:vicilin-like seed storage protein At2g18540 [Anneissia japonica]